MNDIIKSIYTLIACALLFEACADRHSATEHFPEPVPVYYDHNESTDESAFLAYVSAWHWNRAVQAEVFTVHGARTGSENEVRFIAATGERPRDTVGTYYRGQSRIIVESAPAHANPQMAGILALGQVLDLEPADVDCLEVDADCALFTITGEQINVVREMMGLPRLVEPMLYDIREHGTEAVRAFGVYAEAEGLFE